MLLRMLSISPYCFLVRIFSGKRASVLETWLGFRESISAERMRLDFGSMHPPKRDRGTLLWFIYTPVPTIGYLFVVEERESVCVRVRVCF